MFNLFKKNPREKVVKYIKKNFSKPVAEVLIANLKTCFVLDKEGKQELKIGTTKQSGYPDLPNDFIWPEYNGSKLDFILQLNLEEFSAAEVGLPEKGILYFFLDLKGQEFPKKKEQFKVVYETKVIDLKNVKYDKHNQLEEKALKVNTSLTYPENQSYLFGDLELTDEEFDELINMSYPFISELFGGGIYDVGILAESDVIDEWVVQYNQEEGKELNPHDSTNDFVCLLSFLLDEWGFVDSWVHFGIEKEDLKMKRFDKVKISFTCT